MHARTFVLRALGALVLIVAGGVVGATLTAAAGDGPGPSFTDVGEDHPFFDDITWMADHDISGGYTDGTFRGGAPVTRQAMAAFMSRLNSVTHVVSNPADPIVGTEWTVAAACDEDERAISGGIRTDDEDIFVTASYPEGLMWIVHLETEDDTDRNPAPLETYAVCVPGLSGPILD
jgi:hypothetical protein